MTKRSNLIYWIATSWLALGMLSSGIVQVVHSKAEVDFMTNLGYPPYLLTLLGAWKILGVIAMLVPRFPLLKEWAYAGFFFTMSGAAVSHLASKDPVTELFPALLLLALTIASWYLRPADRRLMAANYQTA